MNLKTTQEKKAVMVVGGGIAGIQASHDLAEMGVPVFLVESSPSIGGRMAQLDKTFPTNDCSTCILAPKMTACYNHPLVKTFAYSELIELQGEAPNLIAKIKIKPRYVDEEACKGCGDCFIKCPIKAKSEYDMGLDTRKAIYKPFAQAIPNKAIIDMDICIKCRICEKLCTAKAIRLEQEEVIEEIPVSAVIMATGYDTTDSIPAAFGYGRYKDIVTSLEYERLICASGPYGGHLKRLSDGSEPKRIAFVQCVGSRDHQCNADYCSSVCCMQAVKNAIITKEHDPNAEAIDIYYMDMRAFGKSFESYVESAKNRYGIGFIRSRVSEIYEENGQVTIKYASDRAVGKTPNRTGEIAGKAADNMTGDTVGKASYDLVVLSLGLKPSDASVKLLQGSGIQTDRYGFARTHEFNGTETSKKGVFACGVITGPKDIPETVIEASAAAAAAAASSIGYNQQSIGDISAHDHTSVYTKYFKQEPLPDMRDISKEPIKIGVFVCHCGINIAGYADVDDIVKYAKTLPFVVHSEPSLYACAIDAQGMIADRIAEHGLNRIVIAACTPRTHEALFQDCLAKAGLNPYLLTMANIRDQCTWVHMEDKNAATLKAKELLRMAVGKATFSKELTRKMIPVNKSAMVIGGGVSGMTAALELAELDYNVHLIESSPHLGGNGLQLVNSNHGRPALGYLQRMITAVETHRNIDLNMNTVIENIEGYVGNFKTDIRCGDFTKQIEHGAIIVAVGAKEKKPVEYGYGTDSRVITQMELERMAADGFAAFSEESGKDIQNLVIIQCVGSREPGRTYCSRLCCNQAIKNALLIKKQFKYMDITILYRDIRAYGMAELEYRDAREAGVKFIRYDTDRKPELTDNGILVFDPIAEEEISLPFDQLVLSSGMEPLSYLALAQMLKVPLNQDGFFLEAHVKLRPVDFATEGIYICGLAHGPKSMTESIVQGKAAAGRAATVISKEQLETEGAIASARPDYCAACGDCEKVCAYKAIEIVDGKAQINDVLCKGCGTCSAACRCGAIDINGFTDRQILTEIEYLLRKAI